MQNVEIWKSIEALCNEAESVIKNDDFMITVINSVAPPALAHQRTSHTKTINILSSKPAPPEAQVGIKSKPQENAVDDPLSPATMAEIAAAINRVSQAEQKPQILDQSAQPMSEQLRKDLMIEVSLAVRSVLASELPKMVRHSISESLYEYINSSTDTKAINFRAGETKPIPKKSKKKLTNKNKSAPITVADLEGMSKLNLKVSVIWCRA